MRIFYRCHKFCDVIFEDHWPDLSRTKTNCHDIHADCEISEINILQKFVGVQYCNTDCNNNE